MAFISQWVTILSCDCDEKRHMCRFLSHRHKLQRFAIQFISDHLYSFKEALLQLLPPNIACFNHQTNISILHLLHLIVIYAQSFTVSPSCTQIQPFSPLCFPPIQCAHTPNLGIQKVLTSLSRCSKVGTNKASGGISSHQQSLLCCGEFTLDSSTEKSSKHSSMY